MKDNEEDIFEYFDFMINGMNSSAIRKGKEDPNFYVEDFIKKLHKMKDNEDYGKRLREDIHFIVKIEEIYTSKNLSFEEELKKINVSLHDLKRESKIWHNEIRPQLVKSKISLFTITTIVTFIVFVFFTAIIPYLLFKTEFNILLPFVLLLGKGFILIIALMILFIAIPTYLTFFPIFENQKKTLNKRLLENNKIASRSLLWNDFVGEIQNMNNVKLYKFIDIFPNNTESLDITSQKLQNREILKKISVLNKSKK